jgi:hypothetical protein
VLGIAREEFAVRLRIYRKVCTRRSYAPPQIFD